MKYLIVDDEKIILEGMEDTLKEILGDSAEIFKALLWARLSLKRGTPSRAFTRR